jgi:hypothetical protein
MSELDASRQGADLRPEYDFRGGVRGKYVGRFKGSCRVVELEPDVAEAFPDAASVNEALRDVIAARSVKADAE